MKRDPDASDSQRLVYCKKGHPLIAISVVGLILYVLGSSLSNCLRVLSEPGDHTEPLDLLFVKFLHLIPGCVAVWHGWSASKTSRLVIDRAHEIVTKYTGIFSWHYSKTYALKDFDAVLRSPRGTQENRSISIHSVALSGPRTKVKVLRGLNQEVADQRGREIAGLLGIEFKYEGEHKIPARTSAHYLKILFTIWSLAWAILAYYLVPTALMSMKGLVDFALALFVAVVCTGIFLVGVFLIRHGLKNLQDEASREAEVSSDLQSTAASTATESAAIPEFVRIPMRFSGPNSKTEGDSLLQNLAATAIAIIFFLGFLLGGGFGMYIVVAKPIAQVIDARDWATVPCDIVYSKVVMHTGEGSGYSIEVLYDYAFEGKRYQSSHYEFPVYTRIRYKIKGNQHESSRLEFPASSMTSFSSRKSAQKVVDSLAPNSQTFCYVNPDDPSEAILHRGLPSSLWWGLIPLVLLLLPAASIYGMLASTCMKLMGRRWEAKLSRLDDTGMKRQVLYALVGTCLVMFGIIAVLFSIAWWNLQVEASVPLGATAGPAERRHPILDCRRDKSRYAPLICCCTQKKIQ